MFMDLTKSSSLIVLSPSPLPTVALFRFCLHTYKLSFAAN